MFHGNGYSAGKALPGVSRNGHQLSTNSVDNSGEKHQKSRSGSGFSWPGFESYIF
jgi:hypothetical protein